MNAVPVEVTASLRKDGTVAIAARLSALRQLAMVLRSPAPLAVAITEAPDAGTNSLRSIAIQPTDAKLLVSIAGTNWSSIATITPVTHWPAISSCLHQMRTVSGDT